MYRIWDTDFRSVKAIAKDPRCKTRYEALATLVRWGVPLEQAVIPPSRPSKTVKCWGKVFPNLLAVARDPRCQVPYGTMMARIRCKNWPVEQAVLSSAPPVICWGETFHSLYALSRDPRCQVPYYILLKNLAKGQSPEQATSKLPLGLEEKYDK